MSAIHAQSFDFNRLFQPDELIAEQYDRTNQRTYYSLPELRLTAAVLEDAVATLTTDQRRCGRRQQREFRETLRWMNAPTQHDWPFSFANCCERLGINPSYLRGGLVRKIEALRRGLPSAVEAISTPRRKVVRMRAG